MEHAVTHENLAGFIHSQFSLIYKKPLTKPKKKVPKLIIYSNPQKV